MEDAEKTMVKVVNRLTGEITELEIGSANQAKDIYLELSASETAIKNAKKKIATYLDEWLNQDDSYQFADGKTLRRTQIETRQWTVEGMKSVGFDDSTIAAASKIDMTVARQIVKEMVERGEIALNAGKLLDEAAEVKATKPFVVIR